MRSSRCEGLSERWGGLAALCTADELLFLLGTLTGGGGGGGGGGGYSTRNFCTVDARVSR